MGYTPGPCESPDGHVWEEREVYGCDLCGEHPGVVCTVKGCYETVDLIWEKDPRDADG